jgi:tRNA pseudouridine55 synthase
VARLRRASGVRRIGHAGTLDPLATGVLVVAVGRATRLIEYVTEVDKAYLAAVTFGVQTDTYDAEGTVTARADESAVAALTPERIALALAQFRGVIQQRPPAHSAISVGGKRLYALARAGQEVEAPLRQVEITRLELRDWQPPIATLFMECSKGTYVRSLANDLGAALGTGGHLSALRRTRVGPHRIEAAVPLEILEADLRAGAWDPHAVLPERAVEHLPALAITAAEQTRLEHGLPVAPEAAIAQGVGTLCRALGPDGRLIAMVRVIQHEGERQIRPEKVLSIAA